MQSARRAHMQQPLARAHVGVRVCMRRLAGVGLLLARTCSNPCCTPATIVASADSISCRAEDRASKPRQVTRSTRHTAGAQCNAVAPDDAAAVAMGQRAQMPKQIRIERARLDPPVYDKQTLRVGPSCGLGGHVSRRLG